VVVAVFGDAHGHAEALDAVLAAAERHGVDERWSLGDMCGCGPDEAYVVARTATSCRVALLGNHDYAARDALPAACADWMRTRRPAARRAGVQCWHGSPRDPVHEYVAARNAAACLERQKEPLGLVGHTHLAAAFTDGKPQRIVVGEPLDLSTGKWLLNPGAVGAPFPVRGDFWAAMAAFARAGAWWLELDLDGLVATWRRAPFDPAPVTERARAAGGLR
jgi:predicted phosphodiesterase